MIRVLCTIQTNQSMTRFFKNLRQDLFSKNKTISYLKYALGEIILVVIGILLAVQINSWHQNILRLKQEKVLLGQLKNELLDTYYDLFSDISLLRIGKASQEKILHVIAQDEPYNDMLCFDFYFLKYDEYIYPNTAVYGKIKELGLDIIQNDTLRGNIKMLYEDLFPRISKNTAFTTDISNYLDPYYVTHFTPNTDLDLHYTIPLITDSLGGQSYKQMPIKFPGNNPFIGNLLESLNQSEKSNKGASKLVDTNYTVGFVPLDFEQLKKDPQFLMLLKAVETSRSYKLSRYLQTRLTVRKVVTHIDKILEHD